MRMSKSFNIDQSLKLVNDEECTKVFENDLESDQPAYNRY